MMHLRHGQMSAPTTIPFVIGKRQHVSLAIYDISGRLVRTLIDRTMDSGVYTQEWNGRDANGNTVASGVYFYRLSAGKRMLTRAAVFLK
jgi:flagellar hook assembly protein FlgD